MCAFLVSKNEMVETNVLRDVKCFRCNYHMSIFHSKSQKINIVSTFVKFIQNLVFFCHKKTRMFFQTINPFFTSQFDTIEAN